MPEHLTRSFLVVRSAVALRLGLWRVARKVLHGSLPASRLLFCEPPLAVSNAGLRVCELLVCFKGLANHVPGACNFAKRISTERAQSNIGRLNGITCISPHGWQRQLFKVRVACQANRTCNMLVLEQPGAKIDSASFDLYLKKLGRSGCFTQSS